MGKNKQVYAEARYHELVVKFMWLPELVQGAILNPLRGQDREAYLAWVNMACRVDGATKEQKLAAYHFAWMYWKYHEQGLEPPEPPAWVVSMGSN